MKTFCSSFTFQELQAQVCQSHILLLNRTPRSLADNILHRMNKVNKRHSRGDLVGIETDLVELFEQVCVFSGRVNIDLNNAIIWKYPGVCAYCVRPVCECKGLLIRPPKAPDHVLLPFREKALRWKIKTWVESDWRLYPCNETGRIDKMWRHFLSEGLEFAQEMLKFEDVPSKDLITETGDLGEKIVNLCGVLHLPLLSIWDERYQVPKSANKKVKAAA